jgi:hypothetical protein
MKFEELKLGQKVYDFWFSDLGTGSVIAILKTRAIIWFPEKTLTYDKAHVRFLLPDRSTRR